MLANGLALAEGQYESGVSDTEIKIGNTMPYSGPASSYGTIGKSEAAYFAMINEQGDINGRKINFISRDDGYHPDRGSATLRRCSRVVVGIGSLRTSASQPHFEILPDQSISPEAWRRVVNPI